MTRFVWCSNFYLCSNCYDVVPAQYQLVSELDKNKLFAVFHNLGIPKYQCVLDELIHKVNKSSTTQEQAETVDWEAFYKELRGFLSESHSPRSSLTRNDHALEEVDPEVSDATCDESNGLKKLFRMFNKEDTKNTSEVKSASLFSSVLHVDCPDLFRGDGCEAQSSFTVTLLERKDDPLICLCSEPEDRDSWVDAFRACVITVWEKSSNPDIVEARNNLGWQHIVIRSTYSSLVIMNDSEALECVLQQDNMMGSRPHKRWRDLNSTDEYNGHTALHYATILGHSQCMDVLLRSGAKVTVGDRHGFSPMYHGKEMCETPAP